VRRHALQLQLRNDQSFGRVSRRLVDDVEPGHFAAERNRYGTRPGLHIVRITRHHERRGGRSVALGQPDDRFEHLRISSDTRLERSGQFDAVGGSVGDSQDFFCSPLTERERHVAHFFLSSHTGVRRSLRGNVALHYLQQSARGIECKKVDRSHLIFVGERRRLHDVQVGHDVEIHVQRRGIGYRAALFVAGGQAGCGTEPQQEISKNLFHLQSDLSE